MKIPSKIKGATIVTHYGKSDTKYYGDFYSVEVFVKASDGLEYHTEYGDQYHDKGFDKAEGFIDALKTVFGKFPIINQKLADIEDYE